MSSCAICPRTAPDGQRLCLVHSGDLRRWLAELPRQARLLAAELAPPSSGAGGRSGGRAHAPVPVDLRVLVLLAGGRYDPVPGTDDDGEAPIAATLGAWAGHIAYHYPALGWHPDRDPTATLYVGPCEQAVPARGETITGWCSWLIDYLPFAVTLPIAADLHRGLGDLIHRIRGLTHATPRQHPQAAPCPQCDACALVRTDGSWHITCQLCGHTLDPEEYDTHAAAVLHTIQETRAS